MSKASDWTKKVRNENEPEIRALVERQFNDGARNARIRRDVLVRRWSSVGCYFGASDLIDYVRRSGRFEREMGRQNIDVVVKRVIAKMERENLIESCIGFGPTGRERREWFLTDGPVA